MLKRLIGYFNTLELDLRKKRLQLTTEKGLIEREKELKELVELWKLFQLNGKNKYDQFVNVCIFTSISCRDILLLTNRYLYTDIEVEKNLYGRLLCMTIIEFLHDINGLLGNRLRKELISNGYNQFVDELNRINKSFDRIKKSHHKALGEIRNNAAAHKTKNAKDLIYFTEKLNIEDIAAISRKIQLLNIDFNQLSTKIIRQIGIETKEQIKKIDSSK